MITLICIFGAFMLIPIFAAFLVIIQLLGFAFGILVDAALAIVVMIIIAKILDELF